VLLLKRVRVQTSLTWWENTTKETSQGTRTLAPVVPSGPRSRQGLPAEVRLFPALGCGRRLPLGRPARPPRLLGLPAAPLVHHPPAPSPPPRRLPPQPPPRWPRGRRLAPRRGATPACPGRTALAVAAGRQAVADPQRQQGPGGPPRPRRRRHGQGLQIT